jgi:uncharacterized protein (DUF1697 family)
MPRYAAFLRAVNVGARLVKMETLRTIVANMGFSDVQTMIASGNVVFDTPQRSVGRIEQALEQELERALGFTVTTFVRTFPELIALAEHPLVSGKTLEDGASVYVAFLREPPTQETARKLKALKTKLEDFQLYEHHVLWLVRGRFSDSALSGPSLERTLGVPTTVRNTTTVRRLVDRFAIGSS